MRTFKVILLLVLICHLDIFAQPCLSGDFTFSTQSEIDNFPSLGCTSINGSVTIFGSDIINLNGLSTLTAVTGGLFIRDNAVLANLTGLSSLSTVGSLQIYNNPSLTSLSGINNGLNTIGGDLFISNNNLSNLTGLNGIHTLLGSLQVSEGPTISSLSGLNNLITVNGPIFLGDLDLMTDLTGLSSLTTVGGALEIYDNNILQSLSGFSSFVTSIGGALQVYGNPMLTDLSSLTNLQTISGFMNISNNNTLTTLVGLENINSTGITNLLLQNSPALSFCEINSVCNYLSDLLNFATIQNNASNCDSKETVIASCFSALAVEFISFNARTKSNQNILEWTTLNEKNNKHFEVQKSNDGIEFQKISTLNSNGNSGQNLQVYNFVDEMPYDGINYYRIKQIDLDGKWSYSDIVSISNSKESNKSLKIYPNPSSTYIYADTHNRNRPIIIADLMGNMVYQSKEISEKIDISHLPSGIYTVKTGNENIKMIVTK